jgi:uncharacterized membrane protein
MASATHDPKWLLYLAAAFLALVGLADAIYLTLEQSTGLGLCGRSEGCGRTLDATHLSMGGVPLAAFGACVYGAAFIAATLAGFGNRLARAILAIIVAPMCLASLWLLGMQAFTPRVFCPYCLVSDLITLLLAAIVIADWKRKRCQEPFQI